MSRVHVGYLVANQLLRGQLETVDQLDAGISSVPVGADAGAAAREVQFVLAAALESSAIAADTLRVLYAVATDALNDLATTDRDIADGLQGFARGVFDQ